NPVARVAFGDAGSRCQERKVERLSGCGELASQPAPGRIELLPPGLVQPAKAIRERAGMQPTPSPQPCRKIYVQERALAPLRNCRGQLWRAAALDSSL